MTELVMGEREAEIQARVNVATEGPWRTTGDIQGKDEFWMYYVDVARPNYSGSLPVPARTHDDAQAQADAAFIAHARSDVPYLLARVATLEADTHEIADNQHREGVAELPPVGADPTFEELSATIAGYDDPDDKLTIALGNFNRVRAEREGLRRHNVTLAAEVAALRAELTEAKAEHAAVQEKYAKELARYYHKNRALRADREALAAVVQDVIDNELFPQPDCPDGPGCPGCLEDAMEGKRRLDAALAVPSVDEPASLSSPRPFSPDAAIPVLDRNPVPSVDTTAEAKP